MPDKTSLAASRLEPVQYLAGDPEMGKKAKAGIALCLSGGGYRAMLFHVGSLWRLADAGVLSRLDMVSSVSGGSITAGVLALAWEGLFEGAVLKMERFQELVVAPIRRMARVTIDVPSVIMAALPFVSVSGRVQKAYRAHLFGDASLRNLPDKPLFVFNATSVQSGVRWRFSKASMGDWRVGTVANPDVSLAEAVCASSAFPPFLSPHVMDLTKCAFVPGSGKDLQRQPFISRAVLTDGGVYDNLGLEAAWKSYQTILVSDAGGHLDPEKYPKKNWFCHTYRVLNVIDNQVRSLRVRLLIDSYEAGARTGTFWGIRTNIANYKLKDSLPCPYETTLKLADVPTRLACVPDDLQERLINWGYAVCDTALRKYVDPSLKRPAGFPYPTAGV